MRRPSSSSGFTLFELILVMLLIALTVMLAMPSLADFARGRVVSDAAGHFTAMADFARTRAAADGRAYRVTIDTKGATISVSQDIGSGNFAASDAPDARVFALPQGMQVQTDAPIVDDLPVIQFEPGGRTDPATVTFQDSYGNTVQAACTSPFGYYRIVTGPDAARGLR